jgi:hypothetical protein
MKSLPGQLELPGTESVVNDVTVHSSQELKLPEVAEKSQNRDLRAKFEAQKKVLQRIVVRMLERGETTGMDSDEVRVLRDALVVLGWLPTDLKV